MLSGVESVVALEANYNQSNLGLLEAGPFLDDSLMPLFLLLGEFTLKVVTS